MFPTDMNPTNQIAAEAAHRFYNLDLSNAESLQEIIQSAIEEAVMAQMDKDDEMWSAKLDAARATASEPQPWMLIIDGPEIILDTVGKIFRFPLSDQPTLREVVKLHERQVEQEGSDRFALAILLGSRKCWTKGNPEIPEEISAQFDISLEEAKEIAALSHRPNPYDLTPQQQQENEAKERTFEERLGYDKTSVTFLVFNSGTDAETPQQQQENEAKVRDSMRRLDERKRK